MVASTPQRKKACDFQVEGPDGEAPLERYGVSVYRNSERAERLEETVSNSRRSVLYLRSRVGCAATDEESFR
jgi:hypothetical protein